MKCGLEIQNEVIPQLIILMRNKNLCMVRKLQGKLGHVLFPVNVFFYLRYVFTGTFSG